MLLNVFFLCGFWFWFSHIFSNRSLYVLDYTECNNNTCNIWFIKTTLYSKSCKFHVAQVCFRVKIYRIKKENKETICRLLWTRLSYPANGWTILPTMWTNCTTYASVTIQNVIYIFNINSRNIDGYSRSWIEPSSWQIFSLFSFFIRYILTCKQTCVNWN